MCYCGLPFRGTCPYVLVHPIRNVWSPAACVVELLTTSGACVFWRVTQYGNAAELLGPGPTSRNLIALAKCAFSQNRTSRRRTQTIPPQTIKGGHVLTQCLANATRAQGLVGNARILAHPGLHPRRRRKTAAQLETWLLPWEAPKTRNSHRSVTTICRNI